MDADIAVDSRGLWETAPGLRLHEERVRGIEPPLRAWESHRVRARAGQAVYACAPDQGLCGSRVPCSAGYDGACHVKCEQCASRLDGNVGDFLTPHRGIEVPASPPLRLRRPENRGWSRGGAMQGFDLCLEARGTSVPTTVLGHVDLGHIDESDVAASMYSRFTRPLRDSVSARGSSLVRQFVGSTVGEVGLQVAVELHGHDRLVSFEDRAGNAVHAIHHPSVSPQDDRVRQINSLDQADMFDHAADGGRLGVVEPVDGVHFLDAG